MSDTTSLDRHRYLSLATCRRDGTEVRTPVWFAEVDGLLYVFTTRDAGKVKRLRNSSRARVAACDVRGRVEGGWQEATARVVTDERAIQRARAAFAAKYGWRLWLLDLGSRLSGRIHRRAWLEIAL
jgi:PPOX class probable F420-dependent enzyme